MIDGVEPGMIGFPGRGRCRADVFIILDVAQLAAADQVQIAVAVEIEQKRGAGPADVEHPSEQTELLRPDRRGRTAGVISKPLPSRTIAQ